MENHYIDYLSTQNKAEGNENIKDLFKEYFSMVRPLLNNIFWVDSFTAYLNYTCGVSQSKIGDLIGMSQLGVSRRTRSCIRKLSLYLERPETDSDRISEDLRIFFPEKWIEPLILYYFTFSFSLINKLTGSVFFRNRIITAKDYMDILSASTSEEDFRNKIEHNHEKIYKLLDNGEYKTLLATIRRYNKFYTELLATNTYSYYQSKLFDDKRGNSKK